MGEKHSKTPFKKCPERNSSKLFNTDVQKIQNKNHKILTSIQVILDLREQRILDQQLKKSHSVENDDLVQAAHDKLDAKIRKIKYKKLLNKEIRPQEVIVFKFLAIAAHQELEEQIEKAKEQIAIAHERRTSFAEFHNFSPSSDESGKVIIDENNVEYFDPKIVLGAPIKSLYSIVDDLLKKYFK